MTDAMEVLFRHAQEHIVPSLLSQEEEYPRAAQCAEKQQAALRALLDGPAQDCLDNMLREEELLAFMRERANFRAGFQLALELLRQTP